MRHQKFIIAFICLGFASLIAGCNTVEGIGKDMQSAGQSLEKVSKKTKSDPEKDGDVYDHRDE